MSKLMCVYLDTVQKFDMRSIPKHRRHRAKLTLHGLSYRQFADLHGFKERTVKAAVRGERSAGRITARILATIDAL